MTALNNTNFTFKATQPQTSKMSAQWHSANGADLPSSPDFTSLTITAPPKTDIWRPGPGDTEDVFSAPLLYRTLPVSSFKSISVTVFGSWKTQYDQGGLILSFPNSSGPTKWVKAGIEYFSNAPVLGVVGTDRYSDWSLAPMSGDFQQKAKFKMVKEGTTLWVYGGQVGDGELVALREVKWAFQEGRDEGDVRVGVYAAKPTPDEGEESEKGIEVQFSDLEVAVAE